MNFFYKPFELVRLNMICFVSILLLLLLAPELYVSSTTGASDPLEEDNFDKVRSRGNEKQVLIRLTALCYSKSSMIWAQANVVSLLWEYLKLASSY